ncbi:hypothetical protein JOD24_001169 [Kroppenstedtia sanguinis]
MHCESNSNSFLTSPKFLNGGYISARRYTENIELSAELYLQGSFLLKQPNLEPDPDHIATNLIVIQFCTID